MLIPKLIPNTSQPDGLQRLLGASVIVSNRWPSGAGRDLRLEGGLGQGQGQVEAAAALRYSFWAPKILNRTGARVG